MTYPTPWLLSLLLLLSPLSSASPVADQAPDKVGPNSYVIHGPLGRPSPENRGFMNNPGFIVTSAGVVIIDPGGSVQTGEMVLRQIKIITDQPIAAVFNTHIHGDHWLGNQAIRKRYPDAPIYGHQRMFELIKAGEGKNWQDTMLRLTQGATKGTGIVGPNQVVAGDQSITVGNTQFNIIYEPKAHSDSDIMIEIPSEDLLFLGDNVLSNRLGQMTHGTFIGNIKAIDLALKSKVKNFVPGHGLTGNDSIPKAYKRYLKLLRDKIAELLEEGIEDFEMKPMILKTVAEYATWSGFEDEVGRHISLAFLEVEAEQF